MAKIRISPRLAGFLIATVIKTLGATYRFRIDDRLGMTRANCALPPTIWACWHNCMFVMPLLRSRFARHRTGALLTSASRDGDVLAETCRHFDIDTARGSRSRKKVAALRDSLRCLQRGSDFCITPDGPRGPRYQLQGGVILMAQLSQSGVMPVHVRPERYWEMRTWDRLIIPKPFTKIQVVFDDIVSIPKTADKLSFETERARLETLLRAGATEELKTSFDRAAASPEPASRP